MAVLLFTSVGSPAAQITLAWDSQDGAAGYKIYYGTTSDAYTTSIDVGNATTYPLSLADGHTYYLAATAYDSAHLESDFSDEISYKADLTFYLSAQKGGSGTGRVTSTPSGVDCGSTCGASYNKGTKVKLVPTPDSGSVFAGWTGDCSGNGACSVTMAAGHTVGAIFNAGSCTYSVSSAARSVTYKGGTLIINVNGKDYAGCPAPDIINNSDWITHTVGTFANNRGSLKLSVPEHDSSIGRSGTLTIAGKTVTITQKGKPCALKFDSYTSPVLSGAGGSGAFEVTVAPADCAWTTAPSAASTWIHAIQWNGRVDYTVDENSAASARRGTITVTLGQVKKSFTVRQGGK